MKLVSRKVVSHAEKTVTVGEAVHPRDATFLLLLQSPETPD